MENPTLPQADVRQVWDQIKGPLQELVDEYDEEWRPEDIYAAVVNNEATLYMNEDGFAVVYVEEEFGVRELFMWVGYAFKDRRGGILEKYGAQFLALANTSNASALSWRSKNPIFKDDPRFEAVYTHYRIKV